MLAGHELTPFSASMITDLMDAPRLNIFPAKACLSHHNHHEQTVDDVPTGNVPIGSTPMDNVPIGSAPPTGVPSTNTIKLQRRERELDQVTGLSKPSTMKMPLGVMVPLLMRAAQHNHAWLDDFESDLVQIDADLHQVLMAFKDLSRQQAA